MDEKKSEATQDQNGQVVKKLTNDNMITYPGIHLPNNLSYI